MLPMTLLRRFDCVLDPTKAKVLAGFVLANGSMSPNETRNEGSYDDR